MFAFVIIALWIGSVIAGWLSFWPWLIVPVVAYVLYVIRMMAQMRAARVQFGIPASSTGAPGTSMAGANVRLILLAGLQHLAIFGLAFGAHRLFG